MSYDDSFNDSDEVFSLYSSKNITETFRTQLKKIVAKNKLSTIASQISQEEIRHEKHKSENGEIPTVIKKKGVNSAQKKTRIRVEDVSLNTSTGADEACTLDDSIEVIEVTPKPIRQSRRLRKKRPDSSFDSKESSSITSDVTVIKQATRGRRKSTRKGQKQGTPIHEITLDDSPQESEIDDELNPEVSVKVIWKSMNIRKFRIRKFQKLSHVFEQLSKEENIAKDKIILTFNNVAVNQNDTPESLNLQVYHFLDGGVLNESTNLFCTTNSDTLEFDDKSVTLKFQDVNKRIVTLSLNKNDKLKVALIKCSEQLEIPLQRIKFFFDGEVVQPSETPESLGLEGGEIIDMKITN